MKKVAKSVELVNRKLYDNTEQGLRPCVETLHYLPKSKDMVKRKSRLQTINSANEN